MRDGRKVIVVIPLRESERLKDKAFLPWGHRTILETIHDEWAIIDEVDKIYISTSSPAIRARCVDYNVIDRAPALSLNRVYLIDVLKDAVTRFICDDDDIIIQVDISCPLIHFQQQLALIDAMADGADSVFLRKPLNATIDGDAARCSQDREKRFQMWGSMRARTVKLIRETNDGWGRGENHKDLDIVRPWEVDIHNVWDYYQALAVREL